MFKQKLEKNIWSKDDYYEQAKAGSLDVKHFGMILLKKVANHSNNILDLGCGEGTRLNYLTLHKTYGVGIDISRKAIALARKNYPRLKFLQGNLEDLDFHDNYFDTVYSAFVLEHLDNPDKMLEEAVRVTKNNGNLVFIAPNYGSPNRSSPVFKGSRIKKIITGFIKDLIYIFTQKGDLDWNKVEPDMSNYIIDSDTTVEPYILTLICYLKNQKLKIVRWSTCWDEEMPDAKIQQRLFRSLGELKIYPFTMWGPHLVVQAQKIS